MAYDQQMNVLQIKITGFAVVAPDLQNLLEPVCEGSSSAVRIKRGEGFSSLLSYPVLEQ